MNLLKSDTEFVAGVWQKVQRLEEEKKQQEIEKVTRRLMILQRVVISLVVLISLGCVSVVLWLNIEINQLVLLIVGIVSIILSTFYDNFLEIKDNKGIN